MSATSQGPLAGITVVALEQAVAAPFATARLAAAGARVIKVERPEGDFARGYDRAVRGLSAYFVWLNRGKESIALDLKVAADREVLERMLGAADVFVQNIAPGAAARLGVDGAALRRRHPRLISCHIVGYGPGPYSGRKAYDLLVQAESGLCSVTGTPDGPGRVGVSVADVATGLNAYAAILEAVLQRAQSGAGEAIELSLFDSMAEWMTVPLLQFEDSGRAPARMGLAHPTICPYGAFPCADGRQILLSIQNEREWQRLCTEVLDDPALGLDPRCLGNPARVLHRVYVDGRIATAFAAHSSTSVAAALDRADIAYGWLNDMAGLAAHPQLRREQAGTERGPVSLPAAAARVTGAPRRAGPVPALDEHGSELRAEFGPASGDGIR